MSAPPADETFSEKLFRKCTNEPLVPLGTMATCYFLFNGMKAFHRGEKAKAQLLMRGRVVAQGVTVLAMAFAAFYGMKPHDRPKSMEEVLERKNIR